MRKKQRFVDAYQFTSKTLPGDDAISEPAKTCPYNPGKPLTTPLKMALENQDPFLAQARRCTIVGPLAQDICKSLNIPLENPVNANTKVTN